MSEYISMYRSEYTGMYRSEYIGMYRSEDRSKDRSVFNKWRKTDNIILKQKKEIKNRY